uniref:TRAF-type domain-containing protein n=1 Tax=Helicotheca tamesis TaxID=374047 RepID=A0A7S2HD16_9STRA|mmetsp:Transcript_17101/g.23501  ORF Transcript_17101/g.23501 Transcript_17101/m.23501 type:complete len:482 (+) Transcript_17101:134-1579(+)
MTMTPVSMTGLQETIEIYENQRFWVGGGFSRKGLLPTDRCRAYSTFDGSLSWQSLQGASEGILGKGWHFDDSDDGFVPVGGANGTSDSDGWSYFVDFSSEALRNPSASKGMKHFVRRRRLVRTKTFQPDQFLPQEVHLECEYADSNEVDALSSKMLEALSIATLLRQKQHVTDKLAITLKAKLVDSLNIGDTVAPIPEAEDAHASTRLKNLRKELDGFAEKQETAISVIGKTLNFSGPEALSDRQSEISAKYFSKEERDLIATLAVKHLDPEYRLHCNEMSCTAETCEFYVVSCPNAGCTRRMSKKHLSHHDREECGYKIISCPLGCGDTFPRNRKDVHIADACSARIVSCPFAKVGCPTEVAAKDLAQHLEENVNSHLLLTSNRMMEYEKVFRDMNAKIGHLESENISLRNQLSVSLNKLNTVAADVKVNARKATSISKDVRHVGSQIKTTAKHLGDHEKHTKDEFLKIYKQLKIAGILK